MSNCSPELKKLIPMRRIVAGAVMDTYEDIGKVEHQYSHWASRGLRKLERETLKTTFRKAILTVNRTTNTATLPIDCDEVIDVYVINAVGKKVALPRKNNLVDHKTLKEIPCEDKCDKCNQDKGICEDLTVTEDTTLVLVNDTLYEQTVIKKLYPDGSYYLETKIPVLDVETDAVTYVTNKEFITALDLKPCGCIDDTPENVEKIKCCNYDVYCSYYTTCDSACTEDYGGYKEHEDSGLLSFDKYGRFTKVYIEYWGFLPKINGQYYVPEISSETLINWIKFKKVENKRNIPHWERQWTLDQFERELKDMKRVLGRISISQLVYSIMLTPKFDINYEQEDWCMPVSSSTSTSSASAATSTDSDDCGHNDSTVPGCPPSTICPPNNANFVPFSIGEIAGVGDGPTPGTNVYQNDKLKGAIGVEMIVVNNTNETIKNQQFAIDTVLGTITRYQADNVTPNDWMAGDVLVVPTFFKLM